MPKIENVKIPTDKISLLKNNYFINEKHLESYIVENINSFVRDYLDDKLVSFEVNKLIKNQRFGPRGRRIDIFVKGEKKNYVIELKCPNSGTENRAAIGQILDYGREINGDRELIIISTNFDMNTAKTIEFYSLPIRYVYISKNTILESLGFYT